MPKKITSPELLAMLDSFKEFFLDSTIGFVRAYPVKESRQCGPEDFIADLGGSGTLISAAGIRAILTADHVLSELAESFGLILPQSNGRRAHRIIIEGARRIPIARGPEPSTGPDLALLLLSPVDEAKLEAAGMVFYNLSTRANSILHSSPPLNESSALILCGMVGEWTKCVSASQQFERAIDFRGLFGPVVFANHREEGNFDYISVEVKYDGTYTGPQCFKGCSGGGLWQALLKERDGSVMIDKLLLTGVPFYQSARDNDRRIIECHGRKSIYDIVAKALEKVASESRNR